MLRRYRAHGLTIESEIELPELMPHDGTPNVRVRYGDVPSALAGGVSGGRDYQATRAQYLLNVGHIGRYLVTAGSDVLVAPADGADPFDVRMLLLSSVMGAMMHQRGLLPLHASAIVLDGRGVLFAGRPGTGKSTLAAAFHERGHAIVSDDLSVVALDEHNRLVVAPGCRRVKLLPDSLQRVGARLGSRRWTRAGLEKLAAAIPGDIASTAVPVAGMFILRPGTVDTIALRPLRGHARASALLRQTYRRGIPVALGRQQAHFEQCVRLGGRLNISAVDRPRRFERLNDLVDAITDDIGQAHLDLST